MASSGPLPLMVLLSLGVIDVRTPGEPTSNVL
jgi:hypothetical protein